MLALSTGHHFSNGNKRLALYSYAYFALINKYIWRGIRKHTYQKWFKEHFPNYKLNNEKFHTNAGWALYNFNKAINIKLEQDQNGHDYSFDQLKEITENFMKLISRKK